MFLLTVAMIWTVAAVTPGPNGLAILRCAASGARVAALAAALGVVTGTFIWGVAGWLGVSALFAAAPVAYSLFKLAGAAYLAWMGAAMLIRAWRGEAYGAADDDLTALSARRAFELGLAANLANPKTAIFVASLFASALPAEQDWLDGAAVVLVMVAISALWYSALALLLASPPALRWMRRARRRIDAAAGALFIGFGARLALSER